MKRFSRPSPAMVVASVALFVSLGGTSVAAVNYARNSGKVDGYDAVKASSSTSKAAGRLVATNKSGADKGRVPGSHLADVPLTQTFGRSFDVADNAPGAAVVIGDAGTLGTLTATCNDQSPQAGIEDPVTELSFVNSSGGFINVARRVGVREDSAVTALPNGTIAPVAIGGSNTFTYHVEAGGRNLLVNGVVRQDGRGTATASCLVYGTVMEVS